MAEPLAPKIKITPWTKVWLGPARHTKNKDLTPNPGSELALGLQERLMATPALVAPQTARVPWWRRLFTALGMAQG